MWSSRLRGVSDSAVSEEAVTIFRSVPDFLSVAMASFVEDLWSSIFTPGPTPTLLIATNVAFAALQLVLFALLLATYSLHFIALSIISGGLWYAINWFAAEVKIAQAQLAEEKARNKISADSDTETEVQKVNTKDSQSVVGTGSSFLQPEQDPKKRSRGDNSGDGNTDSEWEKVDESQ